MLKPGRYRLNQYLFDVCRQEDLFRAADSPPDSSRWSNRTSSRNRMTPASRCARRADRQLSIPLVPRGVAGLERAAVAGYLLSQPACLRVALVDTRIQTWQYQGGYARRRINLTLNQNGPDRADRRAGGYRHAAERHG